MPSLVTGNKRAKPAWKARIKFMYKERFIGYFDTYDQADQAERALRLSLTGVEQPTRRLNRDTY